MLNTAEQKRVIEPMDASEYRIIIGMGNTGLSCARYFFKKGIAFCVVDTRLNPPMLEIFKMEFPDLVYCLGDEKGFEVLLNSASEIIVSPGLSRDEIFLKKAKQKNISFSSDIDLFMTETKAPVIAITGSNAKSTVVTLLGEMAKESGVNVAVGGNIGVPALDILHDDCGLYILELSSFQLELAKDLAFEVAVFLNVSEDHMDRYTSVDEYIAAKKNIFLNSKIDICNEDEISTYPDMAHSQELFTFGDGGTYRLYDDDEGERYLAKYDNGVTEKILAVNNLAMLGAHNANNALAALAIGDAVGLSRSAMCKVLSTFKGLPHRCEKVKDVAGVCYINDSKGTNIGATLAAIKGFSQADSPQSDSAKKLILIAGGEGKGADFSELKKPCEQHIKTLILMGKDAPLIAAVFSESAVNVLFALSVEAAVTMAADLAVTGDIVLLSPACASFDMFSGFEERGYCFIDAVEALPK